MLNDLKKYKDMIKYENIEGKLDDKLNNKL